MAEWVVQAAYGHWAVGLNAKPTVLYTYTGVAYTWGACQLGYKPGQLQSSLQTHFYITFIKPVLEYCAPVWHYALKKAQSESLEAVQKRAIHITHNLTRGMPYSSMLLHVNLDSLATRREDLSRRFFRDIMDPASCLHSLLPPPRSTAINSRSSQILPRVHTRTKRYCSFIQHELNHYQ